MREVKFVKVDERYDECTEDGLKIKPFYTWAEKANIFDTMKAQENEVLRDMALVVKTAEYCTNIDFSGMNDAEKYDLVAELRLIEEFKLEVEGYMDMPKLIEREESVYNAFKVLLDGLGEKLDKMDVVGKFSEAMNNVKGN